MNIELFSCAGGLAEGFRRAGIVFDLSFDLDRDACDSYERNLGRRPIRMNVRGLLRLVQSGWRPSGTELVVADPPCTPWSRAGKRLGVEDERDMLGATVELVRLLRPRAYLIGNVPGLDDGPNWPHLQAALAPLRAAGYCVADFCSLDAASFGVPQHRVRPWWFGHLDGPCIRWPVPTHGPPVAYLPGCELQPYVTCRDALQHLAPAELGRLVRVRRGASGHPCSEPDKPANTIAASMPGNGGNVLAADKNHPPRSPDRPHRTVTRGAEYQVALSWPWDRPSTVVAAGPVLAPYGRSGSQGEHQRSHVNAIVLSERAAAILQGFPEGWHFAGRTKKARWSQIGQATPPAFAHAIAARVLEQLGADGVGAAKLTAGGRI